MRNESEVMTQFMNWGKKINIVRAAILTSSRVKKNENIDFLSDYDIELYVSDISFFMDDNWLKEFGNIMVRWPYKPRSTGEDRWITRLILFNDGVRIDFQITDENKIDSNRYINGYKILIDKDNITADISKPTYDEFIIKKPAKEEFETVVNEFWWNVYYVPKYLWRNQITFAKYMLDYVLRYEYLNKIIDWYIACQHNWEIETGALGKYYKILLRDEEWIEFESTYVAGGINENWIGLIRLTDFFRKLAIHLSNVLGYNYPYEIDKDVMHFCKEIMNTKK